MNKLTYAPLHQHTSAGSALDGAALPTPLAEQCALQHTACAITDHGSVLGHFDFDRAMRKAGVKPIYGVEAYHVQDVGRYTGKSEGSDRRVGEQKAQDYPHLTLLAHNRVGYQNLLKLVTASYRNFYFKPLIDDELLVRHAEGLTVLSGCVLSRASRLINAGREEDTLEWMHWCATHLDRFAVELVPCPGLDISESTVPVLYRMACELNLPVVATDDSHWVGQDEFIVQDTLLCVNTGQKVFAPDRKFGLPDIHWRCDGEEVLARLRHHLPTLGDADLRAIVEMSAGIADICEDVELPRAGSPMFTVPEGFTANEMLVCAANDGLSARLIAPGCAATLPDAVAYRKRLERELDTLCRCELANYILVVWDLVREMRKREILVVPRGSAGGSLVLWALGVTVVDPIKHNLPFERFCDENKRDLDIDLDFQHDRRHEAFEYLESRYGAENCAHVANVVTFGARQALIDGGKALEIPEEVIAKLAYLVPEGEEADAGLHDTDVLSRLFANNEKAQALLEEHPALAVVAHLEGQVRNTSIHAGGFIVSNRPIHEFTAVMERPIREKGAIVGYGDRVASLTKDQVAALGALKIDCLGSKTLTAIAETLKALGLPLSYLETLPIEDADVFAMLGEGRNLGIFQLQGTAAGRIMKRLQPETFDEFTAVSALARPGPLQSGAVEHYIRRKHGLEPLPELHPLLGGVLNPTQGIVLYQEQVMALAAAAGFEIADVQKLRKLVSKVVGGDAVDAYKGAFLSGCAERGVPESEAESVWEQCKKAGNYLFCAAHAVQYAYTGMWTGHLKVKEPALFTAALCRNVGSTDPEERQFALLREYVERGGQVDLISLGESGVDFGPGDYGLRIVGGYQSLKGCGPKTAPKVAKKEYRTWEELFAALGRRVGLPLAASGVDQGNPFLLDSDVLQGLAPWYPLRPLTDEEEAVVAQVGSYCINTSQNLAENNYTGDVRFVGRITQVVAVDLIAQAKKYGEAPPAPGEPTTKCRLTLTDGTGSIDVAFSAKCWRQHEGAGLLDGPGEGLGNTCVVECWWSADYSRWFVRRAGLVRIWQPFVPPPVEKKGKRQVAEEDGEESVAAG